MSELVFVYGTLRTGDVRHGVDSFVKMLSPKAFIDGFDMLDLGGFPGLVPGDGRIRGEVHEYEHLRNLDRIEGHPDFYRRRQVPVFNDEGGVIYHDAWVYCLHHVPTRPKLPIIESGDWFAHRGYYKAR
jgi:gamma-glutamylcyclotransferase (GGCT)/AIG2-like uncharacterized protein YtfP